MVGAIETASQEYASSWAREHLEWCGPDCERAIAYGIDVTLLLENLSMSPAERLERLQHVVQFHEALRNARPVDE